MKLKLLSKLFLLVFILPIVTQAQPKIELDVKTIMQDPKTWVGSAPNNPFWSEDGKWIYFNWNPEAADSDSLYKVSANGGKPTKLSRNERLRLAPALNSAKKTGKRQFILWKGTDSESPAPGQMSTAGF